MTIAIAVKSTISALNTKSRSIFRLLAVPFVAVLYPIRNNWFGKNFANIISVLRLPLSLIVVFCWIYPSYKNRNLLDLYMGLAFMSVVLLSDGLDGAIARGLGTVSRFGKAMDPVADKVLYLSMMAALVAGAWAIIPIQVIATMLIFMIPAAYYELRLIIIAISTDKYCREKQVVEPSGANMWGKAKFALQSSAGFVGFGFPFVVAGFSMAMCLLVLSLPLAHMSLRGHQLELEAIQAK